GLRPISSCFPYTTSSDLNARKFSEWLSLFSLGGAAAAVLEFFSAPTRTRFVAADFWQRTPCRKIDISFARAVAIHCHSRHRWLWLARAFGWDVRAGRCRARRVFFEQELRKCRENIFER